MKQSNQIAAIADQTETVWAELHSDFYMKGRISVLENGEKFLQGEFEGFQWKQERACMLAVTRLFRQVLGVGEEELLLRTRVVQDDNSRIRPLMVLLGFGPCPAPELLKAVLAEFVDQTAAQSHLKFSAQNAKLEDKLSGFVKDEAALFLASNGGQQLKRQLHFVVENQEVATIDGVWKMGPKKAVGDTELKTVVGLYEGRLYRSRLLYVIEGGSRARQYVVPYDAGKFEEFLRSLNEDKNAILKIEFLVENQGQGKPIELKSIERVLPPTHLELS